MSTSWKHCCDATTQWSSEFWSSNLLSFYVAGPPQDFKYLLPFFFLQKPVTEWTDGIRLILSNFLLPLEKICHHFAGLCANGLGVQGWGYFFFKYGFVKCYQETISSWLNSYLYSAWSYVSLDKNAVYLIPFSLAGLYIQTRQYTIRMLYLI